MKHGGEKPAEPEEEIRDFPEESDDRPTLYNEPETSEKDDYKDFVFMDEPAKNPEEEKKTKPLPFEEEKPILDYRIIIGGKSREGSLSAGKELYRIGKNRHSDIILETSDDHVSRDFLTLEPVSGEIFLPEAGERRFCSSCLVRGRRKMGAAPRRDFIWR